MRTALIVGVAGTQLSRDEAQFLKDARPAGFILFARNLKDHEQIRALDRRRARRRRRRRSARPHRSGRRPRAAAAPAARPRAAAGRRLRPALRARSRGGACWRPSWRRGSLAADLADLGINTDCAPVLDVPVAGAHDIIGDRAYGRERRAGCRARPGGRAKASWPAACCRSSSTSPATAAPPPTATCRCPSSTERRAELSATDFAPFKALADMPAAMTAHVVFRDIDADAPASTSAIVTRDDHPRRDRLRRPPDERRPLA